MRITHRKRPCAGTGHRRPVLRSLSIALAVLFFSTASMLYGELNMIQLPNGTKLIVKQNPSNRILAIHCFFSTGSYFERARENGITNFVCRTILKGTKTRSALKIAQTMESVGGEISASASEDYAEVSTITTVDDIDVALDVLSDVIINPTFPPDEVERERKGILAALRQQEDNSFRYTYKKFLETLYAGHPYAHSPLGSMETVRLLTRDEIADYHQANFVANNMLIVVVGDVDPQKVAVRIARAFAMHPQAPIDRVVVSKEFKPRFQTETLTKEIEQAFVIVGYVTDEARSEDYPALKVAAAILGSGGSMASRLFVELREKRGLAYAVGSAMPTLRDKSHFFAYIGTKPESAQEARKGLLEVIKSLQTDPLPEEELERAKTHLIGQFRIAHQRNSNQAHYLGLYESVGLGAAYDAVYPDQIRAVTADQVKDVATKYFRTPTTTILQPPAK